MSDPKPPGFDFSSTEMLAGALHAQLLARRRATFEHDIKNVVHGLLSGTELLAKSINSGSARVTPAECLALLQQQLSRTQATLDRMLDEVAPPVQAPTEIDLAELITDCTHALRHQLQMLNMQVAVPPGLKVRGSRVRLKDALLFVMLDCVDRAPARARIAISATHTAGTQRVTLSVQHAQDPSALARSSLTAITPLLASDDMRIEVKDEAASERSVELSLSLAAETSAVQSGALELLIVDANRDAADSLAMLMQLDGFAARACYDINTAIESLRLGATHAVIVDLDGSVDSRSLISTIRSTTSRQPRIIGLSHSKAEAIDGLDASLRKPLNPAALRRAVE